MNSTTTSPLSIDFPRQLVQWMLNTIDESTKQAYRMIWISIKQFLVEHWVIAILFLIALLSIAIFNYLATGRWAMLGSVLYNYLYFGTLFMIALIFGSDVFANDYFKIVLFLLYIVCFTLVRIFLNKTGIRKHRRR